MNQIKTICALKTFAIMLAISTMLTSMSYAQGSVGGPEPVPLTDDEKLEAAKQKGFERDTDAAYKATLKHLKGSDQKIDPWGGVRAPSPTGNK
jgi:hypothetical protein